MIRTPENLAIGRLLGWTAFLATVAVIPGSAYDPINVPKLAVISAGGFMALGALLANRHELMKQQYRLVLIFGLAFIIDLTLVLLVSGTDFDQEFFGTFGRSTGYVAYVSLAALLIAAAVSATSLNLKRFAWLLIGSGIASVFYGVLQTINLDPVDWVNPNSVVIGFLGNPNFQSSFVGFSGVMVFALLVNKDVKPLLRALYIAYLVAATYVIKETVSQQGFLVLLGGIAVVVLIWISKSKFKFLTIPSLVAGLIGVVFVALGSLNSGPLASILYKASVTYRGDYWRAGWKMTLEHPLFGVGLDSYGDWYRRARTVEATLRRGPDVVSNAAHNVLLDFSSNGGFPLLIIYLFMMALVFTATIRVVKRSVSFDPIFAGLFAVWIAYQAQSIISLNQLGLAVWGWIISGLIIGYEINTREVNLPDKENLIQGKKMKPPVQEKMNPKTLMSIFAGLVVGLLVGMPSLVASSKFISALESGSAQIVQQAADLRPGSCEYRKRVAIILANNKLESQALSVLRSGKEVAPDCLEIWKLIAAIPLATSDEVSEAQEQAKRLDPLNPELK